ncbi:LysM domain-containing protein [Pacificoceanicola onchidii]|uniref:LysM domain-containing protein n=1 Tax=Pacificoceanicola onchidii TaxID=2562685 RepID=UPI0010A4D30A|nr:LysM domain-containing protein [Pacificoceanicola onchidii]
MFKENSRYAKLAVKTHVAEDGTKQTYVARRFLPHPDDLTTAGFEEVQPQDRLDQIAARAYGDPTQYWRIVDATLEPEPGKLTEETGRRLRIPMAMPE